MGIKFVVLSEDISKGATDEEAYMEATFDLSYDIASWLECDVYFFHVRFCGTNTTFYDIKSVLGLKAFHTCEF